MTFLYPTIIEDYIENEYSRSPFRWTVVDASTITNPQVTLVRDNGEMKIERDEMSLAPTLDIARKRIQVEAVLAQPRWAILLKCPQPQLGFLSELWSYVLINGSIGQTDRLTLTGLATLPVRPKESHE